MPMRTLSVMAVLVSCSSWTLGQVCGVPPSIPGLDYFLAPDAWNGDGGQSEAGQAQAAHLTYSFPDDGVDWFTVANGRGPNNLNSRLTAVFGAGNRDRGREYIRQALAAYRACSGLTYDEVLDDNSAQTTATERVSSRGDIRIAGVAVAASQACAGGSCLIGRNNFPSDGGDMTLNTDPGTVDILQPLSDYQMFRNLVAHEHGHGIGLYHATPCNQTKIMEPTVPTAISLLQLDDRRGVLRNYDDRFALRAAPNHSLVRAHDFGNLTTPTLRAVRERDLCMTGTGGNEDWFTFTLSIPQSGFISVDPQGGDPYPCGLQTGGCNPTSPPPVDPARAGNLHTTLYDSAGSPLGDIYPGAGIGGILGFSLPAGTYSLRVEDLGPNPSQNQVVQLYELDITLGSTSKAPPVAIAGINKRIAVGDKCFFVGDMNSHATEPGALIARYDWDLDGDGVYETANTSRPNHVYSTAGTVAVRLRVTDSNGKTGTDTIQVTVGSSQCPSPTWQVLDSGLDGTVASLASYDGDLIAGGDTFASAGGNPALNIAAWNGATWRSMGDADSSILAMANYNGMLAVGGSVRTINGLNVGRIALWDGAAWSRLPNSSSNGVTSTNSSVRALCADGTDLYVGGRFDAVAGVTTNNIAKWRGSVSAWGALGAGLGGSQDRVETIAIYQGQIIAAGKLPGVGNIAYWNASSSSWQSLGGGTGGEVNAVVVYNGSLYVGGHFTTAGGMSAKGFVRWSGSPSGGAWQLITPGFSGASVYAMLARGDGVYVTGGFTSVANMSTRMIARWDEASWTTFVVGLGNTGRCIVEHDGNLVFGGEFVDAGNLAAGHVVMWGCPLPPPPCYSNCDASTTPPLLNIADFGCFLQKFAASDPYANCDSSTVEPTLNIADFTCFLQKFAAGCP